MIRRVIKVAEGEYRHEVYPCESVALEFAPKAAALDRTNRAAFYRAVRRSYPVLARAIWRTLQSS